MYSKQFRYLFWSYPSHKCISCVYYSNFKTTSKFPNLKLPKCQKLSQGKTGGIFFVIVIFLRGLIWPKLFQAISFNVLNQNPISKSHGSILMVKFFLCQWLPKQGFQKCFVSSIPKTSSINFCVVSPKFLLPSLKKVVYFCVIIYCVYFILLMWLLFGKIYQTFMKCQKWVKNKLF
uniref:Transmembrane protein n=1 Tax=Panagrolaimus sp. ES5 TaxID=591445 RepID=A0AC34F754_9BILA